MSIISVQTGTTGLAAVVPSFVYIQTTDSSSTVGGTGYLNSNGYADTFSNSQMALISVIDAGVETTALFVIEVDTDGIITLVKY